MKAVKIDIKPCAKPRATQRDKWNPSDATKRYRVFADELRLKAKVAKLKPSGAMCVDFFFSMPKSWSKKKKGEMLGKPHQQRPDLDNLIKAVKDALYNGNLFEPDDSTIWNVVARKYWYDEDQIVIYDREK
jgi:Holliday junction resolvase RusA-like endonuclease